MLRLKRSGIESVILAGSSLLALSGAKSHFCRMTPVSLARAARDFSSILVFWHLKMQIFARPQGHRGASVSKMAPGSLKIGIYIGDCSSTSRGTYDVGSGLVIDTPLSPHFLLASQFTRPHGCDLG